MTLTYKQAALQAQQLRSQGATWPKIAEHLKSVGYTSPFTKEPVGHLTVRNMVVKPTNEPAEEVPVMTVSSPKAETLEAIKKLLAVEGMNVSDQYELVEYLLTRGGRSIEPVSIKRSMTTHKRKRRTKAEMEAARSAAAK